MAGWARLAATAALGTLAAVLLGGGFLAALSGRLAVDFRLLPASGQGCLHGDSLFAGGRHPGTRLRLSPGWRSCSRLSRSLPNDVAALLALVVVAALLVGTLVILRVRDRFVTWRCSCGRRPGRSSIWPVSRPRWRLRWRHLALPEPRLATGHRLGLAVPAKVFLWPVVVWTLATTRTHDGIRDPEWVPLSRSARGLSWASGTCRLPVDASSVGRCERGLRLLVRRHRRSGWTACGCRSRRHAGSRRAASGGLRRPRTPR